MTTKCVSNLNQEVIFCALAEGECLFRQNGLCCEPELESVPAKLRLAR